jgi:CheY-like chemotaxis protein
MPTTSEGTALLGGLRLLLVDDNPLNLMIARKVLEKAGAKVTTAADGREAVAKVEAGDYTLVLMDVQMPEMDGYEATAALRKQRRFADLPIIAVTAHAMDSAREACLKAGMNDYLSKPIDPKTMIALVAQWAKVSPKP